ncbi:hypothetical protein DPMN_179599 [Dreissena polymorpha]|uniref:Uncharacterized protein n=1 Tax=Dreissena polymorpha TaxID=45954 RepID=A0A9D4IJQ3_DREPO|nr:hypothetical protein DPMN_179599 [Dreissena polymorpha]
MYFQLKKKTSELNKACEKHYQLEQELAFHKIDSKFDSLGRGPEHSLDEVRNTEIKHLEVCNVNNWKLPL